MPRDRFSAYRLLAVAFLLGLAVAAWLGSRPAGPAGSFDMGDHLTGYTPDPEGTRAFLSELDRPLFRDAGAEALEKAVAAKADTFIYRAAQKAHQARYGKPWVVGRQGIGDCVSWGWAHGVYVSQSVDWDTGRLGEPPLMPATESVYGGSRVEARNKPEGGGGYSDGSYGGAAARWVRDWGVIYREKTGDHDLAIYSPDRAKAWGNYGNGGQGDKGKLDTIAKKHPAKHVALVRTFDEAAAAISSGFAVPVCSLQGFTSSRDANGYAKASGQWAHCMVFLAVRWKANGSPSDALLCLNSWGPSWISGPKWPEDMPEGSFWVERAVAERMLAGEDSFAVGSVSGFGWRDVNHGNWLAPMPIDTISRSGR
jgi:hypothetical protein